MKFYKVFIISVLIVFFSQLPLSAETFNRVVAVINDDVITLHELNNKFMEVTGRTMDEMKEYNEAEYLDVRQKVLDFLIDEKITDGKIRELGIRIDSIRIDETIENIKKMNHITHEKLIEELKKSGISYDKYRQKIKKDLERSTLINYEVKSKIIIREEQVREYYDKHQEKYIEKGYIHLAGIFLLGNKSDDVTTDQELQNKSKEIIERLRMNEDFAELAKEFSQGPGAEEGGDLGKVHIRKMDPELLDIVKDLDIGSITEPINRNKSIQIFKVLDRKESGIIPYSDVKDAIYEFLYQEEVNKRYSSWIKDLREETYTKIIF